ncbi:hypothetical protein J5J86_23600 [Aquabacter sp. L1I39]|uniref:hypothetical protein n=1 Tax=Aquabacter sp. L1I39 TaxID=2820278 RepID=UPI001ADD371B|nr:hypothetical protein [Aquabacter sp. L1I39]QTL03672.1 hypothetical protein J5J86_23600 [Aquabacter sp. L1I39]
MNAAQIPRRSAGLTPAAGERIAGKASADERVELQCDLAARKKPKAKGMPAAREDAGCALGHEEGALGTLRGRLPQIRAGGRQKGDIGAWRDAGVGGIDQSEDEGAAAEREAQAPSERQGVHLSVR